MRSRTRRSPAAAGRSLPTCHSSVVETRTFSVSLVSKDPSHAVDVFYKYRAEHLPQVGDVIEVVRFLRGRVTHARVTHVDANTVPQIAASEIDG